MYSFFSVSSTILLFVDFFLSVLKRSSLQERLSKFIPKMFYEIDPCGLYYKTFRIIIYDHNDSTIVEPVL